MKAGVPVHVASDGANSLKVIDPVGLKPLESAAESVNVVPMTPPADGVVWNRRLLLDEVFVIVQTTMSFAATVTVGIAPTRATEQLRNPILRTRVRRRVVREVSDRVRPVRLGEREVAREHRQRACALAVERIVLLAPAERRRVARHAQIRGGTGRRRPADEVLRQLDRGERHRDAVGAVVDVELVRTDRVVAVRVDGDPLAP